MRHYKVRDLPGRSGSWPKAPCLGAEVSPKLPSADEPPPHAPRAPATRARAPIATTLHRARAPLAPILRCARAILTVIVAHAGGDWSVAQPRLKTDQPRRTPQAARCSRPPAVVTTSTMTPRHDVLRRKMGMHGRLACTE